MHTDRQTRRHADGQAGRQANTNAIDAHTHTETDARPRAQTGRTHTLSANLEELRRSRRPHEPPPRPVHALRWLVRVAVSVVRGHYPAPWHRPPLLAPTTLVGSGHRTLARPPRVHCCLCNAQKAKAAPSPIAHTVP
eukprot:3525341-Rhodomonas_salina.1